MTILPYVALVAAMSVATPAMAAPWATMSDTSVPDDAIFVAYQDDATPGTQLFFSCYAAQRSVSMGLFIDTPWIDTLEYPTNVAVTFTIDGTAYEGRGFEFSPQGGKTMLQKFHLDDAGNFEQVFVPMLAARDEIVVRYAGETARFSAEGIDPAFRSVLAGCGA